MGKSVNGNLRSHQTNFGRARLSAVILIGGFGVAAFTLESQTPVRQSLSPPFTRHVMTPVGPESPLELRQFIGPVKTDSRGRVITGSNDDPVKTIVGAESAGI